MQAFLAPHGPFGDEVAHGADHRLEWFAHPPVHDVDGRRAVTLDGRDGHLLAVGVGGLGLAQGRRGVYPLAVLLVAVEHVRLADETLVDEFLGVLNGRRVAEREPELGLETLGARQLGGPVGLPCVVMHRLFAKDVFASLDGVPGDLEMGVVAGRDVDHVDVASSRTSR